jgi:hypothetical protein
MFCFILLPCVAELNDFSWLVFKTWVSFPAQERKASHDHVQASPTAIQPYPLLSILHYLFSALSFSGLLSPSFLRYSNSYCIWTSEHYY